MRFIKFNDEIVDSFAFMELVDLAKTFTNERELTVQFGVQSYYHPIEKTIYVSHFWNHRPEQDKMFGMKSDVYLRSIGSYHHTNYLTVERFLKKVKSSPVENFGRQLFMMLEDNRLEDIIVTLRPGTKKAFQKRRALYRKYYETQLTANLERSVYTDAFFTGMYLLLNATSPLQEIPSIHEDIDLVVPFLKSQLEKVYEANSTDDIKRITEQIVEVLEEVLPKDLFNTYFILPEMDFHEDQNGLTFDDLKRTNQLDNDDELTDVKEGDEDIHEDKMPTWHRETSKPTKSFLQFDLEHGTKTDLMGEGTAREGDAHDQALAMVQGRSQQSALNDYANMEAERMSEQEEKSGTNHSYGKENKFAKRKDKELKPVSSEDKVRYDLMKKDIVPFQKKLKTIIQKTLEHKNERPKTDFHYGRLSKKLLKIWTEENPRIFYKKIHPSSQIDAVFTLLVDCSASMYDKMDETKRGIILFHESLKSVLVPHKIVGFWEDTGEATNTYHPNYFQTVIDFHTSFHSASGPEIVQLEPQEDNRDGFAIRHMTKDLINRCEKQKFLIIFSDGEPAAYSYEQNGIVDTHEAVLEARKKGIEVINIFLSNGQVEESAKKTIENIYGNYSIIVSDIHELPTILFPLLKKLLQKSIG
ncbi:VWA domain-containing protein [Bacillus sp. FJAT-47783]|uniref:vWA domain-containing protein n=1 Tax=Bacillus sp. FJAT-47783 TaxID=2922712 RepID=UPI001FAC3FA5|nr:VWA domain-containing protein [Bacillus sp. FJAT-47783]